MTRQTQLTKTGRPAWLVRLEDITRREFMFGALGAALLVACGDDDDDADGGSASGAFPITVEHKYGSTTIPREPGKVVSVGFQDHDVLLALGVKPVAVREWWGEKPFATWPWAQDELGDAEPVVLDSGELDIERVAALKPDLIIGLYSGITEDEYQLLSAIAPTVTQPAEYIEYGMPWREQTLLTGRVLGKEELAKSRIAEVEAAIKATADANPAFKGVTTIMGGPTGDGSYWTYGEDDPRSRLLKEMGFVIPPELAALAGESFSATVSAEQARMLDVDVLIWVLDSGMSEQTFRDDAVLQQLNVVKESRTVLTTFDSDLIGALSFSSVLSLPFALDQFAPQLAAALKA